MSSRPTIADIAQELGVSPSTVSRALRDHPAISEARKIEVRAAAEALGFEVPEPATPFPPTGVGRLIGCVVPTVSHPFFAQVIEKLEAVCSHNGCELVLHNAVGSPALERTAVDRLVARRVDGVFFVPSTPDSSALAECSSRLKTVVITQQSPLCPSIGVDHAEGGRQVAEHFLELGRTSCLLVGSRDDGKFQGFRAYLEAQRLTGFKTQSFEVDGWDDHLSVATHRALTQKFNARSIRDYDCIFGYNDLAAFGVLHALADWGLSAPGDLAVCGFDDTPLAREYRPGLTSVAQPIGQIVRSGFQMLEKLIRDEPIPAGERSFSLKPHLVVRGSTFGGPG